MRILRLLSLATILSITSMNQASAQVSSYGEVGYSFITRGDHTGYHIGLGFDNQLSKHWSLYTGFTTHQAIITTPYHPYTINDYPKSLVTYPYCLGLLGDEMMYEYLDNQGILALGSTPVNAQMDVLKLGAKYHFNLTQKNTLSIRAAGVLAHVKESMRQWEYVISGGTSAIIPVPESFHYLEFMYTRYIDVGVELGLSWDRQVTERSTLSLGFGSVYLPDSENMNWKTTLTLATQM